MTLKNGVTLKSNSGSMTRVTSQLPLGTVYQPSDLHMGIVTRRRNIPGEFNLLSATFMDSSVYSPNGEGPETFKLVTISGSGTVASGGGKYVYTFGSGGWNFQAHARVKFPAPLGQVTATIGTIGHTPAIGFSKAATDFIQVYYHGTDTTLHMQTVKGGVSQRDITKATQTVAPGDQLRLVLNYPAVELWYRSSSSTSGSSWQWLGTEDISAYWDLKTVSEMTQWRAFMGDNLGSAGSGSFLSFSVDIPGAFYGMRDPTPCTFSDGTPFVKDGKYYLAFTVPDISATYQGNHMAIATLDPVSYQVELVSHLFFRYSATQVATNYAGHFVYDEAADVFRVVHCNWGISGSTPTPLWLGTTDRDITKGVHVIPAVQLNLPAPGGVTSVYDPSLRKENGVWKLVGVSNNGTNSFPVLFTSSDLTNWTLAANSTLHAAEGAKWAKIGGTWYAVFGGLSSGDVFDFQCYDSSLNYVGTLPTWSAGFDTLPGYTGVDPGPAPHPCLIPVMDDDRTRYLLVTFDRTNFGAGKAATGACVVMEAAEVPTGHEFARKYLLRAM